MTDTINTSEIEFREVPETAEDAHEELLRLTDPNYGDGTGSVRDGADAEQVAFQIFTQDEDIPNNFDLSALWIFWGQFLDHDLDLTEEQHGEGAELLKAAGPLSVTRSEFLTDEDGVRQHENAITPFIDGSNVYGSDLERQEALRTLEGGKLKTGAVGADGVAILPDAEDVFGDTGNGTFIAGDIRVTENPGLQSLHTLFVNEHNFWADFFAAKNPGMSDEELFQTARVIVESLLQKITYEEFLPVLLGDSLPEYDGFDPEASAQITTEFSTAAFRFGHTSIPNEMTFLNEDGSNSEFDAVIVDPFTRQPSAETVTDGELGLLEVFDNQTPIENGGVAHVLRGVLEEKSQKIDSKVVDALNFFLFTPDGGLTGFSLPERNILRGRDHGIDSYIKVREALVGDIDADALIGSTDFSIISSDPEVQAAFAAAYGTVDQVDLWAGGISEDHVEGVTIGATFQAILVEQFTRTRDADPLFYLNRELPTEIEQIILNNDLSDVIMRSGGVDYVQRDALLASDRIGGTDSGEFLNGDSGRDLIIGFDGDDKIAGKKGDDDLFGGAGQDHINGNIGDDALSGEGGDDKLYGGIGNDELFGGTGNDRIYGNKGDDTAFGGEGDDQIYGNIGSDELKGDNGNDIVLGGVGEDFLFGGEGDDTINGGNDADVLVGGTGNDDLRAGRGDDFVAGEEGDDLIFTGHGQDYVSGGDGSDEIRLGIGADTVLFQAGETGFDKIFNFREDDAIELKGFGVGFEDLELTSQGGGSRISIAGDLIAEVRGPDGMGLTEDDFIFS